MEKLIELLNEYETPRSWVVYKSYDDYDWFFYWVDCDWETEIVWSDSLICSKKYWFIQWLVENEKIDYWKRNPLFITELVGEQEKQVPYSFYEEMLIRLAVSDTPIKDLISYLK